MKIIDGVTYVELDEAKRTAKKVAGRLRDYGATKVLLFGSTAEGDYMPGHSDIDVYFEGVPREKEMAVSGRLMCEFHSYDIDFRPAGLCHARFREAVLRSGVEI